MMQGALQTQAAQGKNVASIKPHTLFDDVYGIAVGVLFVAMGVLPRWLWFSFAGVIVLVMIILAFISF